MLKHVLIFFILISLTGFNADANAQTHYVAVNGSDSNGDGSQQSPWASIGFAIDNVSDGATILVGAGTYNGRVRLDQKFQRGVLIQSNPPYQAKLRHNNGAAVICFTCQGVTLDGFDIAHSASNNRGLVIQIQTNEARDVTLRNNIIHDSTDNDLLKINNGTRDILVQGNIFYNQAGSDEHIDINSVSNVRVIDNVFFNSKSQAITSSFVLVKDSNGNSDGVLGSKDISIRRNIFFNWQGNDGQSFVRIGEDNTANFEAERVLIENNLMLGNSSRLMRSALTIGGSNDIRFQFNTVVGDLPSRSFAARLVRGGRANEGIVLSNNIWSDPTASMGTEGFNGADVFEALAGANGAVRLDNNVYYNGSNAVPPDTAQEVNITKDLHARFGDPLLPAPSSIVLPVYNGATFGGGFVAIRDVFIALANRYGKPASASLAIDQARGPAPQDDLLGATRTGNADIGAIEVGASNPNQPPAPSDTKSVLAWLLLLLD